MDPKSKDEVGVGGISTAGSFEIEMGSGHHQVMLEPGAGSDVGSEGQVKAGNLEGVLENVVELEKLIKDLQVKGDPQGKAMQVELLSKLEKARMEIVDREKAARRMKWKEEVRLEMLKREETKLKLSSTPLEKVTDWKAKADMSKMSLEWREKFKHERTNFLFHEVFPILYGETPEESINEVVLTGRHVSKDWKVTVEACILPTFEPCITGWGYENSGLEGSHDITTFAFQFCSKAKLMRFNYWSEHRYSGKNPFFSRRLAIIGGNGNTEWKNNLEFWKRVEILLRRWGAEIWTVMIRFDKGMTFELMYEQLVKYLKLMPNLRGLAVLDNPRWGSNSPLVTDMMRDLGQDIYGPLRARIERNPLPELPYLAHLQFRDCVVTPLAQAAVAKYSGSLAYLVMREVELGEGEDPREVLTGKDLRLTHLNDLNIVSFAPPGAFDFGRQCPSLHEFTLEQIHVKGPEDVLAFFENLNRLRPISTLRRLSLKIQPTVWGPMLKLSDDQLRGLSLELPQLESFSINVVHLNLKNIDFLLPCASLKVLDLAYHKVKSIMPKDKKASASDGKVKGKKISKDSAGVTVPPQPLDEIIQFFQYTNRLYESNLWKLFPELRLMRINVATSMPRWKSDMDGYHSDKVVNKKVKIYTKEGYQKYRNNMSRGN